MRFLAALAACAILNLRCTPCEVDSDCAAGGRCVDGNCVEGSRGGGVGALTLQPASATVQTSAGQPTPGLTFKVGNAGDAALSFSISCPQGTFLPASGNLNPGGSATISLALPTYFSAGSRTVACTASGSGGPLTFTASVDVGPDVSAPSVALTGPTPGATLSGTVPLSAAANDAVGVAAVDFLVDGSVVATSAGAPFSATWDSTSVWNGAHSLTATARDAAGNSSTSAGLTVSVANYPGAGISVHTTMGLPDRATAEVANKEHYLSVKHQYALSYNGARRVPNWVSWELNTSWLGSVARQNDFRPDDTLPAAIPQAQLADYLNSGWDRGHMCPSEDRTITLLDNQNTFYLTNMVPQADNVNGGPWAQFETYSRSLATAGKELFVVSGGIYAGAPATIGAGAVSVPSSTYKLAVVLDHPGQGAADVTASTRVIALIMPNDNAQVAKSADWHTFRVRPLDIEAQTDLRLLSDVPQEIRSVLENRVDTQP